MPGVQVRILMEGTGAIYTLTTNEAGRYVKTGVETGWYRIEVSAAGFRQALIERLKVDVGTPVTADIKLEVGATAETVVVEAEAAQILTSSAAIGTTVTGRQILELPFTSRDALDLALLVPGSTAGGTPRASSFEALPKSAINITQDGLNTMDNRHRGVQHLDRHLRGRGGRR